MVSKENQEVNSNALEMLDGKEKSRHGSGEKKNLAHDVDKYTKRGTNEIQHGNLAKALKYFERAFVKAQKLGARYPIRACSFNLGAVYIAAKEPEKGLEMLQCAIPPHKQTDGRSNGDLFYNFALGYDALNNPNETTRYLELAFEEYQSEKDNYKMEAEVARKMADIYIDLQEWLSGSRANGLAARAYAILRDWENQAITTCHEATCLYHGRRQDLALQIADDCMIVCQKVPQGASLGYIYNELGLTYSQCRDFGKAATCFELALPLSRSHSGDRNQEAVILQNLGAIYNTIGDFQRAIGFHGGAARKYAEMNNRNAQGKCLANMAFAYSQLGDTAMAGEFYLHAVQTARDTGDTHAQWQALEGLGAVAFNEAQYQKAVQYFKMALSLVSISDENKIARDRIVAKLTDSIQYMTNQEVLEKEERLEQVDILVNDMPRPPTRQELRQREILALRRQEELVLRKRPYEFETVALGVSEYSTDDDVSLERRSIPRSRPRSKRSSRRVKRAGSLSEEPSRSRKRTETDVPPAQETKLNSRADGLNRRTNSVPKDYVDGHRRRAFRRPLLRVDSNDSEEERRKIVNHSRQYSSSAKSSTRKKPSLTDEDDEPDDRFQMGRYPGGGRPSSRQAMRTTSIVEASLMQSLKKIDMPDQGSAPRDRSTDSPTTYYSEQLIESDDESLQRSKGSGQNTKVNGSVGSISQKRVDSNSQPVHTEKEAHQGERAEQDPQIEDRNVCETLSEDDKPADHFKGGLETDPNQLPPAPPVPMTQSLNNTYLPPVKNVQEEKESSGSETESESEEEDDDDEEEEEEDIPERINHKSKNGDVDDNPIYQTIHSLKATTEDITPERSTEPQPGPSHESDEGPPLPPRPSFETMTRAEKEAFLYEYQKKREETIRREDDVDYGNKSSKKGKNKGSRACIVM